MFALASSTHALAFCRTTTCNPSNPAEACEVDGAGCVTSGIPLFWATNCLSIGIQGEGSVRHGISFEALHDAASAAFQSWADAYCLLEQPSIAVNTVGPLTCDASEFNPDGGNVNLLIVRDDEWPYPGGTDTLGRTTLRFDVDTGEILDADIEINGTLGALALDGRVDAADLVSIITHEAGHVLGLSHTTAAGATMTAGYSARDTELRSLERDDVDGVCAVYPPERKPGSTSCLPHNGFADECGGAIVDPPPALRGEAAEPGCWLSVQRGGAPATFGGALVLLGLIAARRRIGRSAARSTRDRAKSSAVAFAALGLIACTESGPEVEKDFELTRFQGRWHEVARIPRDYDARCHDTVADYVLLGADRIEVRHTCFLGSPAGQKQEFQAVASVDDPAVPAKLSLQIGLYSGAYWVLDVGPDYDYALIGHPSRLMLWLLARNPELDPSSHEAALSVGRQQGFGVDQLVRTPQSGIAAKKD